MVTKYSFGKHNKIDRKKKLLFKNRTAECKKHLVVSEIVVDIILSIHCFGFTLDDARRAFK